MLQYFLDCDGGDGQSAQNFKAVSSTDSKALRLYQLEMKTKSQYKLKLCVSIVGGNGEVAKFVDSGLYAECSCPAGKAPKRLHLCMPLKIFADMATLEI